MSSNLGNYHILKQKSIVLLFTKSIQINLTGPSLLALQQKLPSSLLPILVITYLTLLFMGFVLSESLYKFQVMIGEQGSNKL